VSLSGQGHSILACHCGGGSRTAPTTAPQAAEPGLFVAEGIDLIFAHKCEERRKTARRTSPCLPARPQPARQHQGHTNQAYAAGKPRRGCSGAQRGHPSGLPGRAFASASAPGAGCSPARAGEHPARTPPGGLYYGSGRVSVCPARRTLHSDSLRHRGCVSRSCARFAPNTSGLLPALRQQEGTPPTRRPTAGTRPKRSSRRLRPSLRRPTRPFGIYGQSRGH